MFFASKQAGHFPPKLAEALLEKLTRWFCKENPFHYFRVKYGTTSAATSAQRNAIYNIYMEILQTLYNWYAVNWCIYFVCDFFTFCVFVSLVWVTKVEICCCSPSQNLQVLATLVTVEEAPVKVLKEIARTAMTKVPQLVGVTWSKELRRLMIRFGTGNLLGVI